MLSKLKEEVSTAKEATFLKISLEKISLKSPYSEL